jgi:transcriptional regulator
MLRSASDAALSEREWREYLQTDDFGQIVAQESSGRAVVTPSHFIFDGQETIELHVHRLNPIVAALEESRRAVLSVTGAHVYIPTYWNGDIGDDPEWSAPTSYYAAVQVSGPAEVVHDANEVASLLNRQLAHFQPEGGYRPVEPGTSPFGRMLVAIRGIRLRVETVEVKFKFGGNRTPEHRLQMAERLANRNGPRDSEALAHLLRREELLGSRHPDGEAQQLTPLT